MQPPADFLREYFSVRNAVMKRHVVECESFQQEFCRDVRLFGNRYSDLEGEKILEVVGDDTHANVTTTGYMRGKNAMRGRYQLVAVEGAWFIGDFDTECPICKGTGRHRCKGQQCEVPLAKSGISPAEDVCRVCRGDGWISIKKRADDLLED